MPLVIHDSAVEAMLHTRQRERDALLKRAVQMLEQDSRVTAAWLFGSLGRGAEDALSDLDLFVVVADDDAEAVLADRNIHIAGLEPPLLILEAPQNRPPGGAYNMALYAGEYGPHQVDWYWQPRAQAILPTETRLLFDRADLPRQDSQPHFDYQPVPEQNQNECMAQAVNFFWVMLLITAKYAARLPHAPKMELLQWTLPALRNSRQWLGENTSLLVSEDTECTAPADKLRLLRALAADMEAQMPLLAAQGIPVPAVVPAAHRYLNLIEKIMQSESCRESAAT